MYLFVVTQVVEFGLLSNSRHLFGCLTHFHYLREFKELLFNSEIQNP